MFARGVNSNVPQMEVLTVSYMMGRQVNPLMREQQLQDTVFFLMAKGQGKILINGQSNSATADSLWFLPAGSLVQLSLSASSFGTLLLVNRALVPLHHRPMKLRVSNARARSELTSIIGAIETELRCAAKAYELAAASHLGLLMVFLERNERLHLAVEAGPSGQPDTPS